MDIGESYAHLYKNKTHNTKQKKKIFTDGLAKSHARAHVVEDLYSVTQGNREQNTSLLCAAGVRTGSFVSRDFYQKITYAGVIDVRGRFDSVHARSKDHFVIGHARDARFDAVVARSQEILSDYRSALHVSLSPMRMYQVSLTGAMVVGMVSMSLIYRNLGQSAFAQESNEMLQVDDEKRIVRVIESEKDITDDDKIVLDDKVQEEYKNKEVAQKNQKQQEQQRTPVLLEDVVRTDAQADEVKTDMKNDNVQDVQKSEEKKSIDSAQKKDDETSFEASAYELVKGYPIEKMLPYILEQDPEVAKYLIAIAKQESQWGKRVPVLNGQDCFNYWGYRGQRKLMGSGGHTCFNSREDAVKTVGKRLHTLIYENKRATPSKLIVWKCGSSCDGHSQEGVDRWINVVKTYYDELSQG